MARDTRIRERVEVCCEVNDRETEFGDSERRTELRQIGDGDCRCRRVPMVSESRMDQSEALVKIPANQKLVDREWTKQAGADIYETHA